MQIAEFTPLFRCLTVAEMREIGTCQYTVNTRLITDFRSYFISFGDGARLELMHKPEITDDAKALNRMGYAHIAFSVGSKEKVEELTAQLKADDYEVVSGPRTTGDGYFESCVIAIEGNQIEITK